MSSSNNGGRELAKKVVGIIRINEDKKIKRRCGLKE